MAVRTPVSTCRYIAWAALLAPIPFVAQALLLIIHRLLVFCSELFLHPCTALTDTRVPGAKPQTHLGRTHECHALQGPSVPLDLESYFKSSL